MENRVATDMRCQDPSRARRAPGIRRLATSCLVAMVLWLPIDASAVVINEVLNESDFVGIDSSGVDFYFALYEVTALDTNPITVTLDTAEFAPFVTWGLDLGLPPWPTGSDEPYASFIEFAYSTTPAAVSIVVPGLMLDQSFNVLVSTIFYNPTDLGAYTLTLDGAVSVVEVVPAPATFVLLAVGLFAMRLRHRAGRS